jgi:hypothetical protein
MSLHVYYIMQALVHNARQFLRAEEELREPPFARIVALDMLEADLACSARHFHDWYTELQDRMSSSEQRLLKRYVVRELANVERLLLARLKAWNWEFVLDKAGLVIVRDKTDSHRITTERRYLDAVLSWRCAPDLPPDREADDEADRAESLGIKPTMTPEEGELLRPRLLEERRFGSALTSQAPHVTYEDHDELDTCVERVCDYFRRMVSPDELRAKYGTPEPDRHDVVAPLQADDATDTDQPPSESDLETPLSEDQRDFLVAALQLEAFDSDSRRTAEEMVRRAKGDYVDPAGAKRALSDLVSPKGFLCSVVGRQGGYWLTQAGRARAERIKRC